MILCATIGCLIAIWLGYSGLAGRRMQMKIADKTVLVTGANRGIGKALVEEALRRGAKRIYAGARQPLSHLDRRVTPLTLDVTNPAHIQIAVERVESLDI